MVRIGDAEAEAEAEASLLRFARHRNEFELKWVNAVFLMNDNQTLPIEGAKRLSRELSDVPASADMIGLRRSVGMARRTRTIAVPAARISCNRRLSPMPSLLPRVRSGNTMALASPSANARRRFCGAEHKC